MRRLARGRGSLGFLVLLGAGALIFAGVLIALLLRGGEEQKAENKPATTEVTTTTAPATTAPPPPPTPTTTAPPPPPTPTTTAPPPAGPLHAVSVGALSAVVEWTGADPPARVAYGLAEFGPTMWAPVSGRRATLTGLRYSTPYRIWAGDATFDLTTAGPPESPAASIGGGAIRLDGQPFFPMVVLALCPVSYPNAVAAGISLFAENACGGIAEQSAALAGHAFSLTRADEAGASGPGVIGWYYPDEADLKGITGATLPTFPSPETSQRLRVLTLTNHFYSRTAELPAGRGVYPGLIARSDVIGFDLYPLQEFCREEWLPDVAYAQRELVKLAQGRPTFQWIEAQSWKCRQPQLRITPNVLRAESWLAVAGGATGIGYFPGEWDPSVIPAVTQIAREVAAIGGGLTAPASPASATGPVVVGARSFNGALYVIAVNPTRATVRSTITAGGLAGRAAGVLGEGRSVASSGDSFTDTFASRQTHLYVVTAS